MENRVVDYYINNYDEEKRLADGCDNRHTVEREVKKSIIEKYLPKTLIPFILRPFLAYYFSLIAFHSSGT